MQPSTLAGGHSDPEKWAPTSPSHPAPGKLGQELTSCQQSPRGPVPQLPLLCHTHWPHVSPEALSRATSETVWCRVQILAGCTSANTKAVYPRATPE